ncbi:MAG: hypothetical protein QW063_02755 [Candidatus Nanoarchaeia archaeon]
MALRDIFKRKKKEPEYYEVVPPSEFGAYGPASYPQAPAPSGPTIPTPEMEFGGTPPAMAPTPTTAEIENLRQQLEALNYKIDTLKAVLDSINTKLTNIETAMKALPSEKGEGWQY